ncbi:hypothetical protein DFJ74DRAFT_312902 [Hyaloraphidium curvatum]|nr:hypothetical protein DFJ74DRAFT_312902 [Hyaloraphidium curvatum]
MASAGAGKLAGKEGLAQGSFCCAECTAVANDRGSGMQRCGRCKSVRYCSAECRRRTGRSTSGPACRGEQHETAVLFGISSLQTLCSLVFWLVFWRCDRRAALRLRAHNRKTTRSIPKPSMPIPLLSTLHLDRAPQRPKDPQRHPPPRQPARRGGHRHAPRRRRPCGLLGVRQQVSEQVRGHHAVDDGHARVPLEDHGDRADRVDEVHDGPVL